MFRQVLADCCDPRAVQRYGNLWKCFESHQKLSNEYLLAKVGVDTAENEPLEVCPQKEPKVKKKVRQNIGR